MMAVKRKIVLVADAISSMGVRGLEEFCDVDCDYSVTAEEIMVMIGNYFVVNSSHKYSKIICPE